MAERHEVDLLVIGAGPAGLYAAYYAGFRGMRVALMDSLPEPGGQVAALYPEKMIFDVAGFPKVKGQALIDNLVEQAAPFDPVYLLNHRADTLTEREQGVTVTSHRGAAVDCKAVLITGGIGTFTPRPLPNADEFEGNGLVYFVPKLDVMAGKDVLIVGGGDSAFDWAQNLEPIAKSITLIHRRDRFRAHEHTVQQVLGSSVRVMTHTEVAQIMGDGAIEKVEVFHNQTEEREILQVQAVVAALGFTADLGPLKQWGLEIDKRQIVVDTTMRTNLPRVFAAGDITDYPGKVRLISVGFGEAATAVNNAAVVIDPNAKVFPGHSSEQHWPAGAGAALPSVASTTLPGSMAAIGDSITQATNLSASDIGTNPEHSWSTGDDAADSVDSHYERILANDPAISGNNHNVSVNGAKMDDAPGQANDAVATGAEYVTLLLGGNDVCTSSVATMTSVASYEADFRTAMDTLTTGLPNAQIFVASIPDVYQLWDLFKNNRSAKRTWAMFDICQSLLSESNTEADRQAVRTRNIELNQVLADVCAEHASCRYDADAVFDYQFTTADVSSFDYFHPSETGQANLAQTTWTAGYWPTL